MKSFPQIENIDDVLPFVREDIGYTITPHQWGTSITCPRATYSVTPMSRECNGIKFGVDGKLLARPYHRFFRIGSPMMKVEDLEAAGRFDDNYVILEYIDGAMVHPIVVDETVLLCTRDGVTDVAEQAQRYAASRRDPVGLEPWYQDFCYDLAKSNLTPIFQWCPRRPALILTGIRTNHTGEYLLYDAMQTLASPYYIPLVEKFKGEWEGIGAFLKYTDTNNEAYVMRWENGMMGKLDARKRGTGI